MPDSAIDVRRSYPDARAPAGARTVTLAAGGDWSQDLVGDYGHGASRVAVYVPQGASQPVRVGLQAGAIARPFYGDVAPGTELEVPGNVAALRLENLDGSNPVDVRVVATWWPYRIPQDPATPWLPVWASERSWIGDGSTKAAAASSGISALPDDWTIACWFYAAAGHASQEVFSLDVGAFSPNRIRLIHTAAETVTGTVWFSDAAQISRQVSSVAADAWHLAVLTYDKATGQFRLYVDQVPPVSWVTHVGNVVPTDLHWGESWSASERWDGLLSHLGIFSGALDSMIAGWLADPSADWRIPEAIHIYNVANPADSSALFHDWIGAADLATVGSPAFSPLHP